MTRFGSALHLLISTQILTIGNALTVEPTAYLIVPAKAGAREIPQTIFGKGARVICDTYKPVREGSGPRMPFLRWRVLKGHRP